MALSPFFFFLCYGFIFRGLLYSMECVSVKDLEQILAKNLKKNMVLAPQKYKINRGINNPKE